MACLFCRYFKPIEPADHRATREERNKAKSYESKWDRMDALNLARNRVYVDGFCLFSPKAEKTSALNVCAQIAMIEVGGGYGVLQDIEVLYERDILHEWSQRQMDVLVNGTWASRNYKLAETENKRLKAELKTARDRSAKRLARIKALELDAGHEETA